MNLYPATAFIRHLLTARSSAGHGVHSPFVFDFLTTVVRGKSDRQIIREVESLRREMLADRRMVRVTDLGAGSTVHKGQERRISEIASTAALPTRYAMLLSRIAGSIIGVPSDLRSMASAQAESSIFNTRKSGKDKGREDVGGEANLTGKKEEIEAGGREPMESHTGEWEQGEWSKEQGTFHRRPGAGGPGIILELGTSLGISTLALALAAPERRVVTVEGCPALAAIARENLRCHGAVNTEVLNMDFSVALSLLRSEGSRVSMAFIDGNHRGEALKQYVTEISTLGYEMIIVADDIHLNHDMDNTWRSIADPSFHVPASREVPSQAEKMPPVHPGTATATMETFRFGILFCRRSLTPQHYRIRY